VNAQGQMMPAPGDVLAGYEIEDYVARGGMAVVYRARDLSLGRRVALKLIAPELAGNDKFRQRFIRESELAASIDHPNVLPIYAAGEAEGTLYIAMRYVDGQDLGALIRGVGRLEPDRALPIFTQAAAALDTAHAHGLVHRDVKPGNILLARMPSSNGSTVESHTYLTDFGLTRRSSSLSGFTTAGHFIGTIAYVAPEQIEGRNVTHAVDVYAMGCVLYEALSGAPPFERDDDAALLWAHMSTMPQPLSGLVPGIPPGVDEVIARAMAKDPAERTPSCREVIADLRAAFRDSEIRDSGIAAPAAMPTDATDPQPSGPGILAGSTTTPDVSDTADSGGSGPVSRDDPAVEAPDTERTGLTAVPLPGLQRRPPAVSLDDQPGLNNPLPVPPPPAAATGATLVPGTPPPPPPSDRPAFATSAESTSPAEERTDPAAGGPGSDRLDPAGNGSAGNESAGTVTDEPAAVPAVGPTSVPGRVGAPTAAHPRWPWIVAVVTVLALLAGAFFVLPRWLRSEFVPYVGDQESTSWLAFDRPVDWSPHTNLSKTCFCTNQYGPVLESGDWSNVIAAINDGTRVEGLYAEQTTRLDLDDADSVERHLDTFLAENTKELGTPVRTTVDNRAAWAVEGTLIATKDPTLRLDIRYLMVASASGRFTDHIVLFTRDQDAQALAGRMERVEQSIRFLGTG